MRVLIKRLSKRDLEMAKSAASLFLDKGETVTNDVRLAKLLANDSFYLIVAIQERQIVGRLVAYEFELVKDNTKEVYLYEIDVFEEFKKQGIGTQLVEFAKRICKQRKVSHMFVGTEASNIPAQKLYLKTGAKPEGNLPHFTYDL